MQRGLLLVLLCSEFKWVGRSTSSTGHSNDVLPNVDSRMKKYLCTQKSVLLTWINRSPPGR